VTFDALKAAGVPAHARYLKFLPSCQQQCGGRGLLHNQLGEDRSMATGTFKWLDAEKGFCFIAPDDGSADISVHYSASTVRGYRSLEENQRVEFDVVQGQKCPRAENIRLLETA
jgi:CspA family cold shock protein